MNNFKILLEICKTYNIQHEVVIHKGVEMVVVQRDDKQFVSRYAATSVFPNTCEFSARMTRSKTLTRQILQRMQISTAKGFGFTQDELHEVPSLIETNRVTYPIVIKPSEGGRGREVKILHSESQLHDACDEISLSNDSQWLVEEFVRGEEYRILTKNGEPIFSHRKKYPAITGDGKRSIGELLSLFSKNSIVTTLGFHKLTEDHILELDESLEVIQPKNLACGGSYCEYNSTFTTEIRNWCKKIYHATGLSICGIDVIVPGENIQDVNAYTVLELNSSPSITALYNEEGVSAVYNKIWKSTLDEYFLSLN